MNKGFINFLMLNPSTADGEVDDATVTRCIGFAQRWGYDALHIVNLFAYRTRWPYELCEAADPVGSQTDALIEASGYSCPITVAAWGGWGSHPQTAARATRALEILSAVKNHTVMALHINADGSPRHPLYVSYRAALVPYTIDHVKGRR